MPHDYSEDQLIQRSIAEFVEKELGWKSVYAFDQEVLGDNASERCVSFGRTSYHEVLLIRHFCKALKNLNPWFTDKQLQEVVERMTERMSSINHEIQIQKAQEKAIQQPKIPPQSRPREGNRAVRQAGQYAAV